MSFAYLVEHSHDLIVVGGIQGAVENEIGFHALDPLG